MKGPNSIRNMRTETRPIATPRTMRRHSARGITSLPAGKMVPIAAFPLLREDGVRSGRLRFSFESMETAEVLMNAINVDVKAYLVPHLAFGRFNGSMDQLNRSYEGKPPLEGQPVVPYFNKRMTNDPPHQIHKYLGVHTRAGTVFNDAYIEAYNIIWNFRAKNRSPDLTLRPITNGSLAPAFWSHDMFRHIVPDFDQAAIDGAVKLDLVSARIPVSGIGLWADGPAAGPFNSPNWRNSNAKFASTQPADQGRIKRADGVDVTPSPTNRWSQNLAVQENPDLPGFPEIFAELAEAGVSISLSNLELAKKTQAFAKLRQKYNAHDDWIINLLMDGITIPEQALTQPMLLAEKRTIFGMAKRYASDGC